jgi:thiamine transport system ATP-binding protein
VLLLDEPMSALDARLRERLRVQVRRIQSELGITTIYVTHDQEEALAVSDRVAVMRDGALEQVASPRTVYREPATRFVAEFVGDNNVFAGRVTAVEEGGKGDDDGNAASPTAAVDVGGETLRVEIGDATDVAVGDRLTFCVRPEYLRIGDGVSRLAATVASAEFLGETTRVTLDWGGRDLVVRTRDPLSGDIVVGFDPGDAHVIDVDGA